MFIDTHCHLQFSDFDEDRAMVIGNAKKAGVKKFICPGTDLLSSKKAIALAEQHQGIIYVSVGFHPYKAQHNPNVKELEKLILSSSLSHPSSLIPHHSIVAIGECGLDYRAYKGEPATGKKDAQKGLFAEQLELANKQNLPVIMHCRNAYDDFFDVFDSLPSQPAGVIHCFSGGLQEIRMAQKRNLFIGLDGNLTYSTHLQTIVPSIPLSMILLETDAPYLTPIPHRGKRNEPKYLPLVAKAIARLQGISVKTVEETTITNANNLFHV